jgi:hypothetical protein
MLSHFSVAAENLHNTEISGNSDLSERLKSFIQRGFCQVIDVIAHHFLTEA